MPAPTSVSRAAILVVAVTCAAYLNSFWGTFVFDDLHEIDRNPALARLEPPWEAMFAGNKLPARPLPYLSFAVDRAIWGPAPFGFHVTNLAIHVVAALALFDLVRTTLSGPVLRDRFGGRAVPLAAVIAMLWAVHPLQTQSVTYVYQRIESMTGMFAFLALAAFARAAAAAGWTSQRAGSSRHPGAGWLAASVAATAGAMASKENAVVLPLVILAYDWFFVDAPASRADANGRGWLAAVWRRRGFYACLFATWGLVAAQILIQRGKYQEFQETKHPPLAYALTQPEVILHYLRLVVWPVGQRIDWQWPIATGVGRILPPLAVILAALVATAWGTLRRRPWASLGVWFFLGLAVTSSILPVEAVANEHRMYQPLAAVVAGLVLSVVAATDAAAARWRLDPARTMRLLAVVAGSLIGALALLTLLRNSLYAGVDRVWLDVYHQDPGNLRANWFLAGIFDTAGEDEIAEQFAARAVAIKPTEAVFNDIAAVHMHAGDYAGAVRLCRKGLELQEAKLGREHAAVLRTRGDLVIALAMQGEREEAARLCAESLDAMRRVLGPGDPVTITADGAIADAQIAAGDAAGAATRLREVVATARKKLGPTAPVTTNMTLLLARALREAGDVPGAEAVLRGAVADFRQPSFRTAEQVRLLEHMLAGTLAAAGRHGEAVAIRRRMADAARAEHGENDPATNRAAKQLAEALALEAAATGDRPTAVRLWGMLHDDAVRVLGPDDEETRRLARELEAARAAAAAPPR